MGYLCISVVEEGGTLLYFTKLYEIRENVDVFLNDLRFFLRKLPSSQRPPPKSQHPGRE